MSTHKHTPGPWSATHILGRWWIEDADPAAFCRRRIAIVDDGAGIYSPEANARLIAAAPDLLAALEAACAFMNTVIIRGAVKMSEYEDFMEVVEKAISKAKGAVK